MIVNKRVINEMQSTFRLRGISICEILPEAHEPAVLVLNRVEFEEGIRSATGSYKAVAFITRSINFGDEAIQDRRKGLLILLPVILEFPLAKHPIKTGGNNQQILLGIAVNGEFRFFLGRRSWAGCRRSPAGLRCR